MSGQIISPDRRDNMTTHFVPNRLNIRYRVWKLAINRIGYTRPLLLALVQFHLSDKGSLVDVQDVPVPVSFSMNSRHLQSSIDNINIQLNRHCQ